MPPSHWQTEWVKKRVTFPPAPHPCCIPWLFLLGAPSGVADGTLGVYALNAFIVFFQKTQINLPWTRKNTTTTASIPGIFFLSVFFFFFFGNGAGERAKGRVVTPCKDSHGFWIPRPGFRIPGTGFRSLSVKFGFWIPSFSRIPDSLSCIPDSKAQDSGFHKKKFPGVRNPDFLDMEREEEAPAVTP